MVLQFLLLLAWSLLPATTPRTHHVEIRAFVYHPAVVRAQVGDTIAWINRDAVPHTATSKAQSWDTGELAQKSVGKIVVTKRGVHEYICTYHPSMKGRVVVE